MLLDIEKNSVGKKQFLGRDDIRDVILPYSVRKIEDWAFAQCANLQRIAIPDSIEYAGRNIFYACDKLCRVEIYRGRDVNDIINSGYDAERLSCAVRYFGSDIQGWICSAASGEWGILWDKAFTEYLKTPDDLGFMPFLAGGEEDYEDTEYQRRIYSDTTRKRKLKLLLHRLNQRKQFPAPEVEYAGWRFYLCVFASGEDSLRLVAEEFEEDGKNICANLDTCIAEGALDKEKIKIIADMISEEQAEVKAALINRSQSDNSADIWEKYEL